MKKILILLGFILLISGCTNIKNLTIEETLQTLNAYDHKANVYRMGYKYYLPRGVGIKDSTLFNEVLTTGKETYYLYVDALSYNDKIEHKYTANQKSYYSAPITYQDKYGYVEINEVENAKYLIEIMYNYAKIEVIVDREDINDALLTSVSILKSISFNDAIIANLYGNNILKFTEEEFNIFNTTSSDSTYLQTSGDYEEETTDEKLPDTDLLN